MDPGPPYDRHQPRVQKMLDIMDQERLAKNINNVSSKETTEETTEELSASSNGESEKCRICYKTMTDLNKHEYVKPCLCNSYVHHTCLMIWLKERDNDNINLECEACQFKFILSADTIDYIGCTKSWCSNTCVHIQIVSPCIMTYLILGLIMITSGLIMGAYTFSDLACDNKGVGVGFMMLSFVALLYGTFFVLLPAHYIMKDKLNNYKLTIILFAYILISCGIQLIGQGIFNLIKYGDILSTFHPTVATYWIGVLFMVFILIVCGILLLTLYGCAGLYEAMQFSCKQMIDEHRTPGQMMNV
jgi:hypothetical protein